MHLYKIVQTTPLDQRRIKIINKYILGYGHGIVKHANGYKISGTLDKCKVFVTDFSGAKVRCMEDHVQPT